MFIKCESIPCSYFPVPAIGSTSGTNAQGRFTNGFPNALTRDVLRVRDVNSAVSTRVIPGMSFTCNGTIVGFTVAGRQGEGQDPIIQIWRQDSSNAYRTSAEITINEAVCAEISIVLNIPERPDDQVWQCNLNVTNQVLVQAGGILGLVLPPRNDASFQMSFCKS